MKLFLATIALVMVGAFVACSSDDNSPSNGPTKTAAATTRTATTSASGGNTVTVKLQEWSINPDVNSVNAGPVTFNVKNIGPAQKHEFVILKTDLAPQDLPKKADGTVDEEGDGITSPGEIADLAVGEEKSTTMDLTPGKYLFVCNLVDQQVAPPSCTSRTVWLKPSRCVNRESDVNLPGEQKERQRLPFEICSAHGCPRLGGP